MASLNSLEGTSRKNMYGPILVGLALVLAIFFAKPQYDKYYDLGESTKNLEMQKDTSHKKLASLKKAQESLKKDTGTGSNASLVTKIGQPFKNSEILSAIMLDGHTKSLAFAPSIVITDVNIDPGQKMPNGLFQGQVNISITAKSIEDIVDYLSDLTAKKEYAFVLDTISLPIDTKYNQEAAAEEVSVSVTLGVLYYK